MAVVVGYLRVLRFQRGTHRRLEDAPLLLQATAYLRGAVPYGGRFTVTPGFCTLYSTEVMRRLDSVTLTEDIDFCWQIHRKGLEKIR